MPGLNTPGSKYSSVDYCYYHRESYYGISFWEIANITLFASDSWCSLHKIYQWLCSSALLYLTVGSRARVQSTTFNQIGVANVQELYFIQEVFITYLHWSKSSNKPQVLLGARNIILELFDSFWSLLIIIKRPEPNHNFEGTYLEGKSNMPMFRKWWPSIKV